MSTEAVSAAPRRRSKRNKFRTQQALLTAATAVFSERGYDGASVREIAERAGCSEALINRYFGGKRSLMLAVMGNVQSGLQNEIFEALDLPGPLDERLTEMMVNRLAFMQHREQWLRVSFAQSMLDKELGYAAGHTLHDRTIGTLIEKLEERQRAGQIRSDLDLETVATAIVGLSLYLGVLCQIVWQLEPAYLERVAEGFISALCAGIAPEKSRPEPEPAPSEATQPSGRRKRAATELATDRVG